MRREAMMIQPWEWISRLWMRELGQWVCILSVLDRCSSAWLRDYGAVSHPFVGEQEQTPVSEEISGI